MSLKKVIVISSYSRFYKLVVGGGSSGSGNGPWVEEVMPLMFMTIQSMS